MTKREDNKEFPIPCEHREKLSGMDFYTRTLGAPKCVLAPMVDQSELAWRILSRRHGAQLCYSPMFHSSIFTKDVKYRKESLQSCPEDRPLIIQFCGNDPKIMLEAGLMAQDYCDAIDINLGCPQAIAKRGHYGSFLQDEWDLLFKIVRVLHENLKVPVTCKIRVFDDKEKTVRYAKMLEKAGCQLLTVHGRTREQRGPLTGLADWSYIKLVRENVHIPVFANGNILSMEDVDRCLSETGVNAVMVAEGNLHNPALFKRIIPTTWDMAKEYLDLVALYPCPASYVRGHLFKLFHHLLNLKSNSELRTDLARGHSLEELYAVVNSLEVKYKRYHNGDDLFTEDVNVSDCNLSLPPWLCQPYIRLPPDQHLQHLEEKTKIHDDPNTIKRKYFDEDGKEISRKLMKKMRRINRRPEKADGIPERRGDLCTANDCLNPVGQKCEHILCKTCCKAKCFLECYDCPGHRIYIKTRRLASNRKTYGKEDCRTEALMKLNNLNESGIVNENLENNLNNVR